MADLNRLRDALRQADAAGNKEDAQRLADAIRAESTAVPPLSAIGDMIYNMGGDATDAASKAGLPPEIAGGIGMAANVALQAMPLGPAGGFAKAAAPAFETAAKELMWSSLKPDKVARRKGLAERATQTMLDEGVNASQGGVDVLNGRISDLHNQVNDIITNSNATVDKKRVVNYLQGVITKFENRPNALEAQKEVERAWEQFVNHPKISGVDQIPIKTANDLKRGYQRSVGEKGYGELKTPGTESEKAIALGLREQEALAEPGVAPLLSRESDLLNAHGIAKNRVMAARNNNIIGLGALAPDPKSLITFIADKWGLSKSFVARILYSGKEQIPATAARAGVGAAEYDNSSGQ